MTDNEIMKSADNEIVKQKIKAIYPHITVSGAVDKPYYNIDWYDVEKKAMYRGCSSYNLELVHKWLEEEFEVVEADIDDFLNRQKAEIERLNNTIYTFEKHFEFVKAEAVRKFAERLKEKADANEIRIGGKAYTFYMIREDKLANLVKKSGG